MQDDVYNRALFRRKSEAARNKLREMAGVGRRMPQGIMASSQELMAAAAPRAMAPQMTGMMPNMMAPQMRPAAPPMAQAPLPTIVPGMFPQPQPMQMQGQPAAPQPVQQPQPRPMQMQGQPTAPQPVQPAFQPRQQQPVRMNLGGDVALEAVRQGRPEPSLGEQFSAIQGQAQRMPVDITQTPTPRPRDAAQDIVPMVRERLGDNEEAQARFSNVVETLSDPDASDAQRQKVLTESFGAPNSEEGLRDVVSQITGEDIPASATVDELNDAITGVALGRAIGGPGSVAERISDALLVGLQAKRETATGREQFGQQLAVAQARARSSAEGDKGFLETPRGEAALEMYNEFLSQEFKPNQAYARMDEISPGLGTELQRAMAGGQMTTPGAVPRPENADQLLTQARDAIQQGRDRGVVEQMLRDMGVDPAEI